MSQMCYTQQRACRKGLHRIPRTNGAIPLPNTIVQNKPKFSGGMKPATLSRSTLRSRVLDPVKVHSAASFHKDKSNNMARSRQSSSGFNTHATMRHSGYYSSLLLAAGFGVGGATFGHQSTTCSAKKKDRFSEIAEDVEEKAKDVEAKATESMKEVEKEVSAAADDVKSDVKAVVGEIMDSKDAEQAPIEEVDVFLVIAEQTPSTAVLQRTWPAFMIQGLGLISAGTLTIIYPDVALVTLLTLFAIGNSVYGSMRLYHAAVTFKENNYWWVELLDGAISIGVTAAIATMPATSALTLLYLFAGLFVASGSIQIGTGVAYSELPGSARALLGLSGLTSLGLGSWLLYVRPEIGLYSTLIFLGVQYIFRGFSSLTLAFFLKDLPVDKSNPPLDEA